MKAMGVGWLMQNAFYFRGEAFLGQRGAEAARLAPPIVTALRHGPAGRRRHRCAPRDVATIRSCRCNGCWTARPSAACRCAGPRKSPTREEALRLYTQGSAWFSFDDDKRGSLAPGKLADLAVLTKDYFTRAGRGDRRIVSLLTMVGGRVVYAAGPLRGAGGEGRGLSYCAVQYVIAALVTAPPTTQGMPAAVSDTTASAMQPTAIAPWPT